MSINFYKIRIKPSRNKQNRNRRTSLYTGSCIIQTGYPFYFSLTAVISILGAVLLVVLLLILLAVLVILFVLLIVLAVVVTVLCIVLAGLVVQFIVIILCHN